jgi:hypothetical protein
VAKRQPKQEQVGREEKKKVRDRHKKRCEVRGRRRASGGTKTTSHADI